MKVVETKGEVYVGSHLLRASPLWSWPFFMWLGVAEFRVPPKVQQLQQLQQLEQQKEAEYMKMLEAFQIFLGVEVISLIGPIQKR